MMVDKSKLVVYLLMLSVFCLNTPLSIVGVVSEISTYYNISIALSGLFVSSFTFTIAISALFTPIIFANFERKKLFSIILFIFVICNFLTIFTHNLIFGFILRIIPAIFYPVFISIALAVVSEIAIDNQKQNNTTKVLLGISIGSIVGLPITTIIGTTLGFTYVMLWISLIHLIALILIIILFPNIDKNSINFKPKNISKNFLISILGIIMLPIGIGMVYNYMSYFLQSILDFHTFNLSLILFIYGLISIVGTWLGGKFITKNSKFTILSFPIISVLILILLYILSKSIIFAVILLLIVGFLDGEGYNIIQYFQVSFLPDSLEVANGIFLSILNGGIAIGTAIGGFVVSNLGVINMFLIAPLFLIVAVIIFYYLIYQISVDL